MFVIDNIEDFTKYFYQSWIAKADSAGKLVPWYVAAIGGHRVDLTTVEGKHTTVLFDEIIADYKLTAPRLGAISTKHGLCYLTISPVRQYTKGLTRKRVGRFSLATYQNDDEFNRMVEYIFNPVRYSPDDILAKIAAGERLGGAISHKAGIFIKDGLKDPMVSYKNQTIGTIPEKGVVKIFDIYSCYKDYIKTIMPEYSYKVWKVS